MTLKIPAPLSQALSTALAKCRPKHENWDKMYSFSNLTIVSIRPKGVLRMITWRLVCKHHSFIPVYKLAYFRSKQWNHHGAATTDIVVIVSVA